MGTEYKPVTVDNGSVRAFIRKHGAPDHSKPHGPEKTILYYEVTTKDSDDSQFEDMAGKDIPSRGAGDLVVQKAPSGSAEVRSAIVSRPRGVPIASRAKGSPILVNPNDLVREADESIKGDLDEEVLNQEKIERGEAVVDDEVEKVPQPKVNLNSPQALRPYQTSNVAGGSNELPKAPEGVPTVLQPQATVVKDRSGSKTEQDGPKATTANDTTGGQKPAATAGAKSGTQAGTTSAAPAAARGTTASPTTTGKTSPSGAQPTSAKGSAPKSGSSPTAAVSGAKAGTDATSQPNSGGEK